MWWTDRISGVLMLLCMETALMTLPQEKTLEGLARWTADGRILLSLSGADLEGLESVYFFSTDELTVEPSAAQPFEVREGSLELTNQIHVLSHSRIESGSIETDLEPFDFSAVVEL